MTNVTNAWTVLKAFREGYAAAGIVTVSIIPGWGKPGNRYDKGTDEYKAWNLGFQQGKNQKA